MEYSHNHPKPHGQSLNLRIIPVTFHLPSGMVTMATPSGRPAGEFLSEGISPSQGMDTKGPTVSLQSMARATCHIYKEHREDLINMKMAPANVTGEDGNQHSLPGPLVMKDYMLLNDRDRLRKKLLLKYRG